MLNEELEFYYDEMVGYAKQETDESQGELLHRALKALDEAIGWLLEYEIKREGA